MERMEHAHGKLLHGQTTLIEDLDCHLGWHAKGKGHKSYFGYFEASTSQMAQVQQAGCGPFTLVLNDGRTGEIYVTVHPSNIPDKMSADFHVTGEIIDKGHRPRRLQP
jgi:hypothetical protein